MPIALINIALLALGAYMLVRSATLLVQAISVISHYFGFSEFTTAFILMGVVTSIPEIAVSVGAAFTNAPQLALGTALGSNLTDLTLVIAIPILVAGGIKVRSLIARKDILYMAIYSLIPIVMLLDGTISRTDAVILLVFYAFYLFRLLSQRSHFSGNGIHVSHKAALKFGGVFVLATIALFASSQLIVYSSTQLASALNIPILLVGLIIVSAGTSLPELAHGLKSVTLHHDRQVIGDILGSVVANSTVVIAVSAIITPIVVGDINEIFVTLVLFLIVLALFVIGSHIDKKISIKEALVLIGLYIVFLLSEFILEFARSSVF
ncbi:sodium:calcium antiporter [candidate division WWE3 bacterium]|uniref:Sodium:calcium antiporter n=1 Tax=candidate division WWE3 bacterium TaxID=2053526 RepID=A0A955LIZ8_UNCKA|nr:sodium:calcium antiporter [candidate division WWE3 bacterium]